MFTTAQVADGFGVTEQAVRMWAKEGKLPIVQRANLRGDLRFDPAAVERFAQAHGMIFRQPEPEREN